MRLWDVAADNKYASQTPHLSVFSFHLSLIKKACPINRRAGFFCVLYRVRYTYILYAVVVELIVALEAYVVATDANAILIIVERYDKIELVALNGESTLRVRPIH